MFIPTSPCEDDPTTCSICAQVFDGETFPLPGRCHYCGQAPADHHGRCCPHQPQSTDGNVARGSVADNAAVPKSPPPVLVVQDHLERTADRAYHFARQELAKQTMAENTRHFDIATPTEGESVTPRTNQRLKTLEDENALVKTQLAIAQKQNAEMHHLLKQATEALKQAGFGNAIKRPQQPDILAPVPPPPPGPPPPASPPPAKTASTSSSSGLATGGTAPVHCTIQQWENRTNPPGTYPTLGEVQREFNNECMTDQGTQVSIAESATSAGSGAFVEWNKVQLEDY